MMQSRIKNFFAPASPSSPKRPKLDELPTCGEKTEDANFATRNEDDILGSNCDNETPSVPSRVLSSGDRNDEDTQDSDDRPQNCTHECCVDDGRPHQPKIDYNESKRIQGRQTRVFQYNWYKDHSWLSYCESRSRVFCFYCRVAEAKGFLTFSSKAEKTFTKLVITIGKRPKRGFRTMKKPTLIKKHF